MVKTKIKSKAGRIRNPKKVKRWSKGESCLSNPELRKFRDEAATMNFHHVLKNPLLTAKNLATCSSTVEDGIDEDVLSEDVQSLTVSDGKTGRSLSTYKSFASDWSKCSNAAFEKFLGRCKLDSSLHKEMLSILAATTEIINNFGGTHRETEYFASFITALDGCEPNQYHAMMALLSIVTGRVPETVIQKTFKTIYPKLDAILSYGIDNFESPITRVTCDVLKKVLGFQDPSVFIGDLEVRSLVYKILRCTLSENPKVRKKARQAIGFILNRQKEKIGDENITIPVNGSPFIKIVLGWILDQLATYPTCGSKCAGDSIGLLQFVWSSVDSIPSSNTKKLYESVLRVMSSGDISLVKIGFTFFTGAFQTHLQLKDVGKDSETGKSDFVPKLVTALWDFRPDWRNHDTYLLWLNCILNGLIRLNEEDTSLSGPYVSRVLEALTNCWTTTWGLQPSKIFMDNLYYLISPDLTFDHIDPCFEIFSKNLLSIPPNEICLEVLSTFLNCLTPEQFTISGREVLLQLLQLRGSSLEKIENRITKLLGQFIKSFGIENLWISLDEEIRMNVILPLVRENLSGSEISFWKKHIYPSLLLKQPKHVREVWDSLVGFCRDPKDPENFPAELVGKTIVNKPKWRLVALAALRQFSLWPQSKSVLKQYANNYLPLLFNLYVNERQAGLESKKKKIQSTSLDAHTEEMEIVSVPDANLEENMGHSDAIGKTIQEYLPHLDPEFIQDFLERAIKKYSEGTTEEKGPILDLLTFLGIYSMDVDQQSQLHEIIKPLLINDEHMKRGYRLLQSLLQNEFLIVNEEFQEKIVDLLKECKGKTKSNAEPLRLECLNILILKDEKWLTEFLPEAILNLLSVNTRARKVSQKFITKLCETLKEKKIHLEKVEDIVRLGLESGNSFIMSCTIHFLSKLYKVIPRSNPDEALVNICINHLMKNDQMDLEHKKKIIVDPTVSKEALSFLSLLLSIYKSKMGPYASKIGEILSIQGTKGISSLPRKEMNKILARMIKIFGVGGLKGVLTNSEDPKMCRRIKNIQRKLRKLKESKIGLTKRKLMKEEDYPEEEDDESEEEDAEIDGVFENEYKNKTKRENLVMKEGVVDFLDPKALTASLVSKPKSQVASGKVEFLTSSDGKLIIEELDERKRGRKRAFEEFDEEIESKTKSHQAFLSDDESLDENEEEQLRSSKKKKKKSNSGLSTTSSRTSAKNTKSKKGRSTQSVKSLKTNRSSTSKINVSRVNEDRPKIRAKRRGIHREIDRKNLRKGSVKSFNSKTERFNYKN